MPIIEVTLAEGRTPAQLRELTDAVQRAGRYRTSSRLPTCHRCRVPGLRSTRTTPLRTCEGYLVFRRLLRHQHLGGCVLDPLGASSSWKIHDYSDSRAIVDDRRISVVSGGALGFARPASAKCTFKKIDVPPSTPRPTPVMPISQVAARRAKVPVFGNPSGRSKTFRGA